MPTLEERRAEIERMEADLERHKAEGQAKRDALSVANRAFSQAMVDADSDAVKVHVDSLSGWAVVDRLSGDRVAVRCTARSIWVRHIGSEGKPLRFKAPTKSSHDVDWFSVDAYGRKGYRCRINADDAEATVKALKG